MEPRNGDLKKTPEEQKAARPSRFQIVKLEERIAPRTGHYHYHYPGWYKHGHYGPPGQTK
jgi:hypothetical protein